MTNVLEVRTFDRLTEAAFALAFPATNPSSIDRLVFLALLYRAVLESSLVVEVKLASLTATTGYSSTTCREALRRLEIIGLAKNEQRGRFGNRVRITDPASFAPTIEATEISQNVDIERVDFFKDRAHIAALLARQNSLCLYSLCRLDESTVELDHFQPSSKGGDGSHRNIVVCTFDSNKSKGDKDGFEFLRERFRKGFLSEDEFEKQMELALSITEGRLLPNL